MMAKGRFAVLSGDHDQCDLDIPTMMFQTEEDVPTGHAPVELVVPVPVPVTKSSTPELEYLKDRVQRDVEARAPELPGESQSRTGNNQDSQVL